MKQNETTLHQNRPSIMEQIQLSFVPNYHPEKRIIYKKMLAMKG